MVLPPVFDQDLSFARAVEDFTVRELISEARIEAVALAVLARRPRLKVGGSGDDGSDPVADSLGYELGAVAGSDERWDAAQDEQVT